MSVLPRPRFLLTAVLVLLGGAAACSSSSPEKATGLLFIYSGRPPPTWVIQGDTVQGIRDRLKGLSAAQVPGEFPRFGILGIAVQNGASLPGLPDWVVVSGGVVQTVTGATTSYFHDDKELADYVLTNAAAAGIVKRRSP